MITDTIMNQAKKYLRFLLIILIFFAATANVNKGIAVMPDTSMEFTDVNRGHTNYVSITKLKEWDIIEGYEDGKFKPSKNINRAEALKMITLATGVFTEEEIEQAELKEDEQRPFPDTPMDAWYTKYLIPAKELEIIHGHPDGTFKPGDEINLAEALKILLESEKTQRAINLEETLKTLYEDTPADAWYSRYTSYTGTKGIINIYNSNTVNPGQLLTRGYLAEIIYRTIMSREGYEFGKATWYGAALHGNMTASGEIFDKNEMTAAHKQLPFGTIVEVTNLANNKKVEVRITDRGPYGPGRVIDLSSKAFSQIASLGTGVINAKINILGQE